ncbi:MAG: SDR family oxidoreductase [Spirochaetaceae bacterium]|nr:SDR family oxidoreductase [Spirochaetaceae bacterium]
MRRLENKTALITGAAQGLGEAIARLFAREGAFVYIADTQEEAGKKTAGSICAECGAGSAGAAGAGGAGVPAAGAGGSGAFFVPLDVTREESWQAVLAAVETKSGRLDILVNNAGINIREPIEQMQAASLDAMLAVNVKGPFLGIKHFLPLMRRGGGGSIINMSSVCGLIGHRYTTEAYTVTKGALTLLTKTIAVRYAKDNIRANSIHPSTVNTPLVQELFKNPDRKAERLGEVPLGRLATEADVAAAALFLASDEAAFINGIALPVDGGTTAD